MSIAKAASMTTKGVPIAMTKRMKRQNRMIPKSTATPRLRFSPTAWAKLLYLRDYGDTEVGGFGIAATDDLLFVEDLQLVKQVCSWAHVAFDDDSVADLFDSQVDAGHRPAQFARIWVHSHPGDCPNPSLTDEETFDRVFGRSDWAVMFILAREGRSYARLRFNVGPGAEFEIPVEVDYVRHFGGCDPDAWEREYLVNVQPQSPTRRSISASELVLGSPFGEEPTDEWYGGWLDYLEGEEKMEGLLHEGN
jgi:hypothetical protein